MLAFSMQDWFFRINFTVSCGGEDQLDAPIAEFHPDPAGYGADSDVVINNKWLHAASEDDVRAVLTHECQHAIETFITSRRRK